MSPTDVMLPIKASMDLNDPHFRYKMPMITSKIEGKGNGIKTVCTNLIALAKSLHRPPAYLLKYFGAEFGANIKVVKDIYIINGQHDEEKLLAQVYGFIKRFVLCKKCTNPETDLSVEKKEIKQKCLACGYVTTIPKTHNLCKYILNHMPEVQVKDKSTKKSNKSSKSGKTKRENNSGNDHNNSDNCYGDDTDEFDDQDLTPEAYSERMKNLCEGLNSDVYLSDPKESANKFFLLLKEKIESKEIYNSEIHKFLHSEAVRLNIKDKATLILSELLFTRNMFEEIKEHRLLLLRFTHDNLKSQKYLLAGFEKLVGLVYVNELMPKVPIILKKLYDEDLLEEEAILEWSKKASKKYVPKTVAVEIHQRAEKFISWLKVADVASESDNEDEKDEEFDFVFSHRAQDGIHVAKTASFIKMETDDGLDELIEDI